MDAIYLFEGKQFDVNVDLENWNFDYLMGCDLDIYNPDVRTELFNWGDWYLKTAGVDGFRFDAVKHVDSDFFIDWLNHLKETSNHELFVVGEYWSAQSESLKRFIDKTHGGMMLFDAGLHFNFASASKHGKDYDLQQIFDNSLVKAYPNLAVTLLSNHDTQPLQAIESVEEPWFKSLAYAIILLRRDGYPCVFDADYYGAKYEGFGRDGKKCEIDMPSRWHSRNHEQW